MGNRANVEIQYEAGQSIFFYSHWDATGVDKIVINAIQRGKGRWSDESYLARIIFCEMVKNSILDETGYGISPDEYETGSPKCVVNMASKTIIMTNGIKRSFVEIAK